MNRLCIDCTHVNKHGTKNSRVWTCHSPNNVLPGINMVTGEPNTDPLYKFCTTLRSGDTECGKGGLWWEPRE